MTCSQETSGTLPRHWARDWPISTPIVVYPSNPMARYEAVVIGHTHTMLKVRIETPEARKLRGDFVRVAPRNCSRRGPL